MPKSRSNDPKRLKGAQVFPSNHPFVQNPDGSRSNVITSVQSFGDHDNRRHVVIPTMVEGKRLTDSQAVSQARSKGLKNYPSSSHLSQAVTFSKNIHEKIDAKGRLTKDITPTGTAVPKSSKLKGKAIAPKPRTTKRR